MGDLMPDELLDVSLDDLPSVCEAVARKLLGFGNGPKLFGEERMQVIVLSTCLQGWAAQRIARAHRL